ncbi:MAG: hypothetical protein O3C60_17540 [Planctomycetota bacterium]|nr:hypothetical protein [Planctomycetota bacterium]
MQLCQTTAFAIGDLRLPAIDPSGNRILLPYLSSTTLNVGRDEETKRNGLFQKDKDWLSNFWPKPAYEAPKSIPLCGSPQADLAVPLPREEAPEIKQKSWIPRDKLLSKLLPAPGGWLEEAELQIAPLRTVARVGSEVILVGGVCTRPGVLIRGEVVEWYLDPRSVGQFSDGGSQFFGPVHNLLYGRATYTEPDYVLSLGAPGPRILTRGTKSVTDDILLEPGQAWVSLFSDKPGTSYVVAYAPRLPSCDEQQLRAVVHWVEGEWVFPQPTVARAGSAQDLTTTVRSYQTGEPLGGWPVRYDILSGPGIFDGTDDKTASVVTGSDGLATVRVNGPPDTNGTTRIRIAVTQPGSTGSQPLVVGQGDTTIDWNAAQIDLKIEGPPTATLDENVTYTVTIRNLGTSATPPLTLIDDLPLELMWQDSDLPSTPSGQRQTWMLDPIPPQGLKQLLIRAKINRIGRFDHCVKLLNIEGGPRESCISTVVDASPLEVRVTGNPRAEQGERTTFHIDITNRGTTTLTDVKLRAEFDRGLEHYDPTLNGPAPNSEAGVLERILTDAIPPGQSLSRDITFSVIEGGQQCVAVRAESGSIVSSDQACVQVSGGSALPRGQLRLESVGAPMSSPMKIGELREYEISFTNSGVTALTDVVIDLEADGALEISRTTPGYSPTNWGVTWQQARIEPGETVQKRVEVRAETASTQACLQVTVTSREGMKEQQRDCPPITSRGGAPAFGDPNSTPGLPSENPPGTGRGSSNSLLLEFQSVNPNAIINQQTSLYITLVSEAAYPIQDVEMRVNLSAGLDIIDASGNGIGFRPSADGRTITFDNILTIRPGERIRVEVRVRPTQTGQATATVEVQGEQLIQPLEQQQRLTVTN